MCLHIFISKMERTIPTSESYVKHMEMLESPEGETEAGRVSVDERLSLDSDQGFWSQLTPCGAPGCFPHSEISLCSGFRCTGRLEAPHVPCGLAHLCLLWVSEAEAWWQPAGQPHSLQGIHH